MAALPAFLVAILAVVLGAAALGAIFYILFKAFGLIAHVLGRLFRFIGAEITDAARLVGSLVVLPIFATLVVLNILIGRWSAGSHFARAFTGEFKAAGGCLYRLALGNPARLFGVQGALEGLEHRVPQALAEAPGRDKPAHRVGQFEGYRIVGSLPGGGSGGKLYVAEPDELKRAALSRRGFADLGQVVLKVFSTKDGSTLDQIVREGRALEAARRLGLVLEHQSEPDRFWYVMRYVPGESLARLTQRLHAESAPGGLDDPRLRRALGFLDDLLVSLQTYHDGGLWHKDVKPDNIIVDRPDAHDARAHLVDFGLVTPIRSAMTLTTHGTEYFRDPELVRQALRGAKVHQIDGRKFDVYSAGAVLYSLLENSFPAHGGLSQITRRCPDALRWIVRRAMTDYDKRYPTAALMLADLRVVREAADPFALKPIDLPSVKGNDPHPEPHADAHAGHATPAPHHPIDNPEPVFARAGTPVPPPPGPAVGPERLRLRNWWSGRYAVDEPAPASPAQPQSRAPSPPGDRRSAPEQLASARERARLARRRAHERIAERRARLARSGRPAGAAFKNDPGRGVLGAVVFFILLGLAIGGGMAFLKSSARSPAVVLAPEPPLPPIEPEMLPDARAHGPELGTVLVASLLATPIAPELRASITGAIETMEDAGVTIVGDYSDDDTLSPDALVSTLAHVKAAAAARPADDADLAKDLMSAALLLPEIDGILWLAPSGNPDRPVSIILAGEGFFWRGSERDTEIDDWVRRAAAYLAEQN